MFFELGSFVELMIEGSRCSGSVRRVRPWPAYRLEPHLLAHTLGAPRHLGGSCVGEHLLPAIFVCFGACIRQCAEVNVIRILTIFM